jgi:archaellum biogenesis protein FlaJ (TadC family)
MVSPANVRFGRLTPQEVMGTLKSTGSRDPDVLFAAKVTMLETVKPLKIMGIWAYVTGGLCCLLILLAFIGIPLLIFGWWVRKRAKENIETIESTFAEYVRSIGASSRVA